MLRKINTPNEKQTPLAWQEKTRDKESLLLGNTVVISTCSLMLRLSANPLNKSHLRKYRFVCSHFLSRGRVLNQCHGLTGGTQRPIHGQADRPNTHSYIRGGSGGLSCWGMEKKSFIYIHIGIPQR